MSKLCGFTGWLLALDEALREEAGKCKRCGKDRGGLVPGGMSKAQVGICDCAPSVQVEPEAETP